MRSVYLPEDIATQAYIISNKNKDAAASVLFELM
jgi:hypothetical protein